MVEYSLVPVFSFSYTSMDLEENSLQEINLMKSRYKDNIIAAQVELDAIEHISNGNISKMMNDNKPLFMKYLGIFNKGREDIESYHLDLSAVTQ